FVDGKQAGVVRFPGGELDLTSACRQGAKHVLSMLVVAMPLRGVMLSYSDTASARQVRGTVQRRGLCGDVFLVATPPGARIADLRVDTSVRKGEVSVDAALQKPNPGDSYSLRARIMQDGREVIAFQSKPVTVAGLEDGRLRFTEKWKPEKLWDLH